MFDILPLLDFTSVFTSVPIFFSCQSACQCTYTGGSLRACTRARACLYIVSWSIYSISYSLPERRVVHACRHFLPPISASQWTCRRRCRYRADIEPCLHSCLCLPERRVVHACRLCRSSVGTNQCWHQSVLAQSMF